MVIKIEHTKSKQRYSSVKITEMLKQRGIVCNPKTIAKIMISDGLRSVVNKKFSRTTNSKHNLAVFPNILNREFIVPRANYAWVVITYVRTNKVIGYAMSDIVGIMRLRKNTKLF